MPQTPPSRPRSNVYAMPNPEKSSTGSNIKAIVITAALTALVGVATVGAATGIWRAATRRASRLMKRQEAEQLVAAASAPPAGPYAQGGYLVWPQTMPPPSSRGSMPDALRDVPNLVQPPPQIIPPSAPTPIVAVPSPEIVAELRKMGSTFDRRLGGIERRLDEFDASDEGDEDEEIDDEDDEEESPPPKKGRRR